MKVAHVKQHYSTPYHLAQYPPTPDVEGRRRRRLVKHESMIKTHLPILVGAYIVTAFAAIRAALSRA